MRIAVVAVLLLPALFLGGEAAAQDGETKDEKPIPVIVLGTTQLLETPSGFDAFCAENADKTRTELRAEIVAKLKAIAAEEQPKILEALGNPKDTKPLWIVNAVVTSMKPSEVEAARELDVVKWVYPAGFVPNGRAKGAPDDVSEVVKKRKEKEFTTKRKEIGWHLEELGVTKVWDELGIHGQGALVVSYDHGLNYEHEDLRDRIWRNPNEKPNNGKDDDENGLVDDYYGWDFTRETPEVIDKGKRQHGTLTSCLVVGDGRSGKITGVAPRAQLMPVRANGGPYVAARALQYAIENDGDVLSMSFSIPNLGHVRGLWRMMAENATCAGLVLVSGAGNFRVQEEPPVEIRIPEGIPCLICVGGVKRDLTPAPFSSQGPVEWESVRFYGDYPMPEGLIKPDVSAFPGPALSLVSTTDEDGYLPDKNGRRGNSLSAPQVAGVIALMLSANPELLPWDVKAILERTAKDLPPEGKDPATGAGLVDAFAAVKAAQAAMAVTGEAADEELDAE